MKRLLARALELTVLLTVSSLASAAMLVDTGPGLTKPTSYLAIHGPAGGSGNGSYQRVAGQVTFDNDVAINAIQGWMENSGGHSLVISIYDNNSGRPGSELFSQSSSLAGQWGAPEWAGISGLTWSLPKGTYWITFAALGLIDIGMPSGASAPLASYALDSSYTNGWFLVGGWNLGVRVEGELSQVPLPSAGLLFASLLPVLSAFTRRRAAGQR